MARRKGLGRKKRSTVREKMWEEKHEDSFTHDLARHRRGRLRLGEAVDAVPGQPEGKCLPNATVITHSRRWAFVSYDDGLSDAPENPGPLCRIDERLREEEESLLAPGDRVQVQFEKGEGVVVATAPRKTRLMRLGGVHSRIKQQVLAANIDELVIVASVKKPLFSPGLVDRFLIAAQQGGVEPVLCFNKIDLDAPPAAFLGLYQELGIPVFCTSCITGEGIQELEDCLAGKLCVFAGHSGVGKSSLLNAMDPELKLVTREVSEATLKGRHATTAGVLYMLHRDIRVIDTPGIRALGLWGLSAEEVSLYFPEIATESLYCKFRNCTHIHEKNCAVQKAVQQGVIARARYESYRRIRSSIEAMKPDWL